MKILNDVRESAAALALNLLTFALEGVVGVPAPRLAAMALAHAVKALHRAGANQEVARDALREWISLIYTHADNDRYASAPWRGGTSPLSGWRRWVAETALDGFALGVVHVLRAPQGQVAALFTACAALLFYEAGTRRAAAFLWAMMAVDALYDPAPEAVS